MLITIIVGIVVIFFIIGIVQKKEEQKTFRNYTQLSGGFRVSFPILCKILDDEFGMTLVTDTGDDFFYQMEVKYNFNLIGLIRIGRRIDYTKNNLLYADFITNQGDKKSGLPIRFDGETTEEEYKSFIQQSFSTIFDSNLYLTDKSFLNYFQKKDIEVLKSNRGSTIIIKEYSCSSSNPIGDIVSTKTYIDNKLVKYEEDIIKNRNYENEEYIYEGDVLKYTLTENEYFKMKNKYVYNSYGLLSEILTERYHKETENRREFISKSFTYNELNMLVEESHYGGNGEVFYYNTKTYDDLNNKIIEIVKNDGNYKRFENKFDAKGRIIKTLFFEKEVSFNSPTIELFEYDDEKYILDKIWKHNENSNLTCIYHDSSWRILKELFYNGQNILYCRVDYQYANDKLVLKESANPENNSKCCTKYYYHDDKLIKEENSYSYQESTWTKYVYS